ncbi:AI-2E family transporter [Motilibacter deserti]|uniref:AI-2E family transporter n=1 Tax=Motilibacter deserti TaxID=2714956 RepID=A0ABX0GPV1_9ACTN|nr:AI-2E family transporter [Motilibacter deserti]NHC12868.1 AI-2E family transporter [Motilibacter deserti]
MSTAVPGPARPNRSLAWVAKATVVVLATLLLAYFVYQLRSVVVAVFLGLFLAVGFDPVIRRLERAGLRRGLAVLVFLLGIIGLLALFIAYAVTPAVNELSGLVQDLPDLIQRLAERNETVAEWVDESDIQQRLQDSLSSLPGYVASSLQTAVDVITSFIGGVFSLLTVLALMVYFMMALPRMRAFAHRALGNEERVDVMEEALAKVGGYVTGQLTVCLCAGTFAFVVLEVLGVPYAAVLGISVALFDAVPQIGATIGAIIVTLVALTESLTTGLIVFALLLAYQQLENYVIAPRVFSRSVNLSPVAAFIAVLCGVSLAGFVGALTALPVAAALKVIMRYTFRRQLAEIGVEEEGAAQDEADEAGGRVVGAEAPDRQEEVPEGRGSDAYAPAHAVAHAPAPLPPGGDHHAADEDPVR